MPATQARAVALRRALFRAGIFPPWIRYLTSLGIGFFRFAVTSEHRPADIDCLAETIRRGLAL
jgi:hypothetical protein